MQTILLKIEIPDDLRHKDVIEDLKFGIHLVVGSGDVDCPYLTKLKRVRIKRYFPKRSKPYVKRPILKGD